MVNFSATFFAPFFCKPLRCLDVICLCPLVSAAQQENDRVPVPLVVNPVAWAIIDAQFANPGSNRPYIARIPKCQTIKSRCNQRPYPLILETIAPSSKRFALPEFDHLNSVVYKLPHFLSSRRLPKIDKVCYHPKHGL